MPRDGKRAMFADTKAWFLATAVACMAILLLRLFLIEYDVVQGTSMCTTLYNGDIVIGYRTAVIPCVRRGDMITVQQGDQMIIKRVLGLPGERVQIDDHGYLYANGRKLDARWQIPAVGLDFAYMDVQLGDDEYFIVGDNRYDSYDSRYFGPVLSEYIRGVIVLRFFPFTLY